MAALNVQPGSNVISIASAGDNSLALLTSRPNQVLAVDTDIKQIHLTNLKKIAIQQLNHSQMVSFLGFKACEDRWAIFQQLKPLLDEQAQVFFAQHQRWIEKGVIHSGKLERYFKWFRRVILPLVAGKTKMAELQMPKSKAEQSRYYEQEWNGKRWRMLFKFFFGREVMQEIGREKAYFKHNQEKVGDNILRKTAAHLKDIACQENYFLEYIISGEFKRQLPFYARKENFEIIRSNLGALKTQHIAFEALLPKLSNYQYLNLSNIFEYMSSAHTEALLESMVPLLPTDARLAYWNMMVARPLHQYSQGLNLEKHNYSKTDKGFFYDDFFLNLVV